jgi:hypothetical protein
VSTHPATGLAVLMLGAALALTGCTGTHAPATPPAPTLAVSGLDDQFAQALPPGRPGTPPGSLPVPATVDGADPDAVGRAALTLMWTMDASIDSSQYQAELRAAPYLTEAYAQDFRDPPPRAGAGAEWTSWAAHRAYTVVALQAEHDDRPLDTDTTARRQWDISATPTGRDGWRGEPLTATAFVTLTRPAAGQPWRVATIDTTF